MPFDLPKKVITGKQCFLKSVPGNEATWNPDRSCWQVKGGTALTSPENLGYHPMATPRRHLNLSSVASMTARIACAPTSPGHPSPAFAAFSSSVCFLILKLQRAQCSQALCPWQPPLHPGHSGVIHVSMLVGYAFSSRPLAWTQTWTATAYLAFPLRYFTNPIWLRLNSWLSPRDPLSSKSVYQ